MGEQNLIHSAVDDAIARTVAIAGLLGIALIHILQSPVAFDDTLYLGLLFVAAIVAALGLAAVFARSSDDRAWEAAGLLAVLLLIGYVLSRTSGLPAATDDIGDWREPLGLASLVVETLVVFVSAAVLATRSSESTMRRPAGMWMRRGGPQPSA